MKYWQIFKTLLIYSSTCAKWRRYWREILCFSESFVCL